MRNVVATDWVAEQVELQRFTRAALRVKLSCGELRLAISRREISEK